MLIDGLWTEYHMKVRDKLVIRLRDNCVYEATDNVVDNLVMIYKTQLVIEGESNEN